MFFQKRVLVLGSAVLCMALASHANLLQNGSFENGAFVPSEPSSMLLGVGSTTITGWEVIDRGLAWDLTPNPYNLTATDGSYFLDLTGDIDNAPFAGMQQTVATTIGGQYELTFDIGSDIYYDAIGSQGPVPLIPVSIFATAGSTSQLFTTPTPTGINEWHSFTLDFTATAASTTITLEGQATENIAYIGLDNVSVELVPEPGTLALFAGSGLLALFGWRRSRKT
jgi:hypothetical protein